MGDNDLENLHIYTFSGIIKLFEFSEKDDTKIPPTATCLGFVEYAKLGNKKLPVFTEVSIQNDLNKKYDSINDLPDILPSNCFDLSQKAQDVAHI